MTKIKKIVAAAVAAVTMGTIGVTASAAINDWGDFNLDFVANEDNVYTPAARKTNSYASAAAVTVKSGANSLRPVYFNVWSSPDELYGQNLTNTVTIRSDGESEYMEYDTRTGNPGTNDRFYLHADSSFSMNLEGRWTP